MYIPNSVEDLTSEVLSSLEYYELGEETIVVATYDFHCAPIIEKENKLEMYKQSVTQVVHALADKFPKTGYEVTQASRQSIINQCIQHIQDIIYEVSPVSAYLESENNIDIHKLPRAVAGMSIELTANEEHEPNSLRVLTALAVLNSLNNYELKSLDNMQLN